jgi:hypothetical protein
MAKYVNTFYTEENNFQLEKKIWNKSFIKYFNIIILFVSLLSLVEYEEKTNNNINNQTFNKTSFNNINDEFVDKNNNENNTNQTVNTLITNNPIVQSNDKVILIEIINFIEEEDINDFIDEVKKELKNLNEIQANIILKRSKFGIIKELKITNIKNYNNLKTIFEKIQYDNNIIVTIE